MPKKLTIENIIKRSKKVHGDKYDYSKVVYINNRKKVIIICPIHGEFQQNIDNHLKGSGCKNCQYDKLNEINSSTDNEFIGKAQSVHGDKYDYSLVKYKNAKTKVKIICKEHGVFEQTPDGHLRNNGCPKCVIAGGWKTSDWIEASKKSKHFDSFKVYILKCTGNNEEFYKIGKTYNTVEKRFLGKRSMPYDYEILKTFQGEAQEMSKLERRLQKQNKHFKYTPNIKFNGQEECFSKLNFYDI